jgi:hypothetical protein
MNDNNKTLSSISGLGIGLFLGAGLMYYLDPDRGRRRRALVIDQAVHLKRETGEFVDRKARHFGNRARGIVAEAKGAIGLNRSADTSERPADSQPAPSVSSNDMEASVDNGRGGGDE